MSLKTEDEKDGSAQSAPARESSRDRLGSPLHGLRFTFTLGEAYRIAAHDHREPRRDRRQSIQRSRGSLGGAGGDVSASAAAAAATAASNAIRAATAQAESRPVV